MNHTSSHAIVSMYSLVSPDPQRIARFWSELVGLPIAPDASEDLVMLDLDHVVGPITWVIERDQPASGKAPFALDLTVEDGQWAAAAERAESLGAQRMADRDDDGVRWIEMRDPDGNRFRIFAPRPA